MAVHRHAARKRPLLEQIELQRLTEPVEERTTGAEHDRVREEQQLVEQVRAQQRGGERGAADADIAVAGPPELGEPLDGIRAADDGRVVGCRAAGARDEHLGPVCPDAAELAQGSARRSTCQRMNRTGW